MKSLFNTAGTAVALFLATTEFAFADIIPEPGSITLVGLGLVAAVWVLHRGKKK